MSRCPLPLSPLAVCLLSLPSIAVAQAKDIYDAGTLNTLSLKFANNNWLSTIKANKTSEKYIKADLTVNGTTWKNVGVRGRGATTWGIGVQSGKVPFKISFDEFVKGQRYHGYKAINLNNGAYDASFLREVLTFRIMREWVPAPKANFVKLVCNGVNWGVYTQMQPVNKDFVAEWWKHANGNRYKGSRNFGTTLPLMSSPRADSYVDLKAAVATSQLQWPAKGVEMPKLIDVDEAHRVMALNSFIYNTDAFPAHNYYVYVDPHHNQLHIIPWDVNLSYSSTNFFYLTAPRASSFAGVGNGSLWNRRYQAHMRSFAEQFDIPLYVKWVQAYHKLLGAEIKKDKKWFYSHSQFLADASTLGNALNKSISGVKTQLGATPIKFSLPTRTPDTPTSLESVWLTITAKSTTKLTRVTVHWRSRGYFRETTMFDDGKHQDGKALDGVYGAKLSPQGVDSKVDYYFSAETAAAMAYHPSAASHKPFRYGSKWPKVDSTKLMISEFVGNNVRGLKDEKGEHEDWIELTNLTAQNLVVGGMYLSDDIQNPKLWKLPKGTTIPANGRLLIWADDDTGDGPLHSNFKIGTKKGVLFAIDTDGSTLLDYVEHAVQYPDIATARLTDKVSPWVLTNPPTPLASNIPGPCGSRQYSLPDPSRTPLALTMVGAPKLGGKISFGLAGASANGAYLLMVSTSPDVVHVPGWTFPLLLGNPIAVSVMVTANAKGGATIPVTVPSTKGLEGLLVSMQAIAVVGAEAVASNGLELRLCK